MLKKTLMDLSFCRNLEIRYTNDKFRPISNILEHFDLTYKESLDREQLLLNKIEDLTMELNNLSDLKLLEEKRLKNKLERYENSKSWMITSPLRKISTFIKNKRN